MEKVPYSEFDLTGKVAVVTGVGSGLGYHIALRPEIRIGNSLFSFTKI